MDDDPEIAWICLSDLHLGGRTSLLTNVDDHGRPAVDRANEVATRLVEALRHLVAGQTAKPRLVLLGDVLELALMPPGPTLMALERFLELLSDGDPVVAREVWYLPGNHDHHVWEVAREEMYAQEVWATQAGAPLPDAWHISAMTVVDGDDQRMPLRGRPTTPALLAAAGRRVGGMQVRVVYPNLAVPGDDGRLVVFHHGHFTEPIYTLMTALREAVFPLEAAERRAERSKFWLLEEDNYAWIEFIWSGLGRSGAAGGAVGTGFEMLGDDRAAQALAARVAAVITETVRGRHPKRWKRALMSVASPITRAVLVEIVESMRDRERFRVGGAFDDRTRDGVGGYLSGPLLAQHRDESRKLRRPRSSSLTFVFGHTHKPFAASMRAAGWEGETRVLNTGGWVVDGVDAEPVTGAAVVLLDRRLDAAAVHVSTQSANPANQIVRVMAPERDPSKNALWRSLQRRIDPHADPWRALARANAAEVARRRRQLADRLAVQVAALD